MAQEINMVSIPVDEYYDLLHKAMKHDMIVLAIKRKSYASTPRTDYIFFKDSELSEMLKVISPELDHYFTTLLRAREAQAAEKEEEEHDI